MVSNIRKLTPQREIELVLQLRTKLPIYVISAHDHHPFDISALLPSQTPFNMSQEAHKHYHAIVTVDPTASSASPIDQGPQKGYFDDEATRLLLSLSPTDRILDSGTAIVMHEQNSQFPVLIQTPKILEGYQNRALLDAQIVGNEASINLPNYAVILVL